MFLTDEYPERFESSSTFWGGTYRGRAIDAELQPDKTWGVWVAGSKAVSGRKSLIQSLQIVKCDIDWFDFQEGWRGVARVVHGRARTLIEGVIADHPDADTAEVINVASGRIAQGDDAAVWGWWTRLTRPEQARYVDAVMECRIVNLFRPIIGGLWEEVVPHEKIPGERPLTLAEQKARRAAREPKPKKKPKPKPTLRRAPREPEVPRQFGVCKRCHVCMAYDVAQGCCTVCGRGLTRLNPAEVCGLCYEWAYRYVREHGGTLVHGTVSEPGNLAKQYGHGWVETDDGRVLDWQTMDAKLYPRFEDEGWPKDLFYEAFQPKKMKRYEPDEAAETMLRFNHMGPWHGKGSKAKPMPEWLRRDIEELEQNPKGHWIDSPTFRYQLFIPRHEKEWKGLPKKLRLGATDPRQGLQNKPFGAFWTSTMGQYEGEDTSDWESWMRGNMPSWHVPKGIVLEVDSRANVKHLRTKQEAEDFLDEYGTPGLLSQVTGELPRRESDLFGEGKWWGMMQVTPDWDRVFAEFDGLHLEGGALAHPAFYGWDAESTAWFTTKPLTVVREIELSEAPAWDEDEDEGEEDNPRPRRKRKRLKSGRLTQGENARLFRRLMRLD
jgi:hypothetical protein